MKAKSSTPELLRLWVSSLSENTIWKGLIEINPVILLIILLAATIVGYKLISQVPSLLHTPLMSGMNALSGVTVLGALTVTAVMTKMPFFGYAAIILAFVNVIGGFAVTHRMLRMFKSDKKVSGKEKA